MVQPSVISFRTEGEPQADPSLRSRPAGCRRTSPGRPLSADEKSSLTVAVQSVFRKLDKLYTEIVPRFQHYGFTPPSAGVVARDLSEKIEESIRQHCKTFDEGPGHADLRRSGQPWEVKICKDNGLTINQSKHVDGENYIVINYRSPSHVRTIWVLWRAEDAFFSPRKRNTNARALRRRAAEMNIEVLYRADR